jgi:hypothetical protein
LSGEWEELIVSNRRGGWRSRGRSSLPVTGGEWEEQREELIVSNRRGAGGAGGGTGGEWKKQRKELIGAHCIPLPSSSSTTLHFVSSFRTVILGTLIMQTCHATVAFSWLLDGSSIFGRPMP